MASYSPRRPPVTLTCPVCNELFSVAAPKADRGRRYCSKSCVDQSKIGTPAWNKGTGLLEAKVCQGCTAEFTTRPTDTTRFCSRQCYWDSVGREWSRKNLLRVRARPEVQEALQQHLTSDSNPFTRPEIRAKAHATLRDGGWTNLNGGNGTPITAPVRRLMASLGPGWETELVIPTKGCPHPALPYHYKVDLGLASAMVAVEADGSSHLTKSRKVLDKKKDRALTYLGWTVLRFSNRVIESDTSECIRIIQETVSRS